MKSLFKFSLLTMALAAMNLTAFAGPGQQVFRPVDAQEYGVLKPGTEVAHECPHCGSITVSKVGKSHHKGHTCPECKMSVTYRESGSGKGDRFKLIDCIDEKSGKKMSARVCAAH